VKKLLFLKSNPVDTRDLRLENEEKAIIAALERSDSRTAYMLIPRGAVTKEDLTTHLYEHKPAFLHISGHGNSERKLFLEDSDGYKEEVSLKHFLTFIENFKHIECLFLNTCHSLDFDEQIKSDILLLLSGPEWEAGTNLVLFYRYCRYR